MAATHKWWPARQIEGKKGRGGGGWRSSGWREAATRPQACSANRGAAKEHRDLRKVMGGLGERGVAGNSEERQPEATRAAELTTRLENGVSTVDDEGGVLAGHPHGLAKLKVETSWPHVASIAGGKRLEMTMARGCSVEGWLRQRIGEMERWPVLPLRLRSQWWRAGAVDGVRTVAAVPGKAMAHSGVDESGGGARLESASAGERGGARGGGVSGWKEGKGVEAGVEFGTAIPIAVAAQRGGHAHNGKRRPEHSGKRQWLGFAWGERERARGARARRGNERGGLREAF
uniref:Uncharacterized protein n=1 Tax=Oryza sativa subsp. japonica TaxID=39947 RepID=Q69TM3_ORYSJ|nr:hypothetical protein [Oryza sativa Japonica Group]